MEIYREMGGCVDGKTGVDRERDRQSEISKYLQRVSTFSLYMLSS